MAVASGCALLVDLDGLSGGAPDPTSDANAPDADARDAAADAADPLVTAHGSGKDGPLEVVSPVVVNGYAAVAAIAPAGTRVLTVESVGEMTVGAAVIVWQTAGLSPPTPGEDAPIKPEADSPLGRYTFARVVSIDASKVTLDRALPFGVLASGAQLVRVPEHTDVTVKAGGALVAKPWDGRSGGIVAMLASGTLTNDGAIHADGVGFRGGPGFGQIGYVEKCADLSGPVDGGFSARGEGLATAAFVPDASAPGAIGGSGNVANGGGGGDCHNAGGGGGGNGGQGGRGGVSFDNDRVVGGHGGAQIAAGLAERLWLGGGGGAGHGDDDPDESLGVGGAGGGVVFVSAGAVAGGGELRAEGAAGATAIINGGGGGGAGGSVWVAVDGTLTCGRVSARGGAGGASPSTSASGLRFGPGGGGAGGRVRVSSRGGACPLDAAGGEGGLCAIDGGARSARGASAGAVGVLE